jgi:hypothetical protein
VSRNIDARLDALTQTVGLLAQMHKDNETWMKERTAQLMEVTTRLAHIIEMHEHRQDSHDDRLDNLEG